MLEGNFYATLICEYTILTDFIYMRLQLLYLCTFFLYQTQSPESVENQFFFKQIKTGFMGKY